MACARPLRGSGPRSAVKRLAGSCTQPAVVETRPNARLAHPAVGLHVDVFHEMLDDDKVTLRCC